MSDTSGRKQTVADTELFTGLSGEGRRLFDSRLKRRCIAKGRQLIAKGDDVSGAYFVLRGRLRVYTYTPSGKEATLYLIEPGETCVLALNSMFNRILYPAWVETECETELGVLPGDIYRSLFASEKTIQDLTVKALSTALFRLIEELEQVHAQRLDQRLAGFLLSHARSADLTVFKTQQEIAAHIGTSREVIARLLGQFSARKWVKTGRGKVYLTDTKALVSLLEHSV